MSITINAAFDSGNIVVDSIDGTAARLSIRKDRESDDSSGWKLDSWCSAGCRN